ncbi:MAG: Lrp/AsnC family transcriptional regulator [Ruminococcaceae bacterium]|nr:Lrp/AsnC family transcriptional regulator [Oscillospiraceae bacterium]
MKSMLELLENDSTLTAEQLAIMIGGDVEEIKALIRSYEKDGVIVGYKTLIDWDKTDREFVTALIELKVEPQIDRGFDSIAERICNFPEVESVFLMSGGFDIAVMIEGKTLKEVAFFVAEKLSTMEGVTGTATHFVLRKYKDKNTIYRRKPVDERGICAL